MTSRPIETVYVGYATRLIINELHEIKPAGHGNIRRDETRKQSPPQNRPWRMREKTAVPASASSRILSRTRFQSCVTLQPGD